MALTDNMTQDDETLDRQALLSQMQGSPLANARQQNTGVVGPRTSQPAPAADPAPAAAPAVDNSKWDTDGYSKPSYTASAYGAAPAGFDGAKWQDANHQTPKYVVGRILTEGNMKDEGQRAAAIANIQKAYPGATYNGKDKITMPDGGTIDIFHGASAGEWTPQWLPETGPGGKPLEQAPAAIPTAGTEQMNSYVPTDMGTYNTLQEQIKKLLGGDQALNREALLAQMAR